MQAQLLWLHGLVYLSLAGAAWTYAVRTRRSGFARRRITYYMAGFDFVERIPWWVRWHDTTTQRPFAPHAAPAYHTSRAGRGPGVRGL